MISSSTPASTPLFSRKPWSFDDGCPILTDGTLLKDHACEIATDAAPEPPAPVMAEIPLGKWVTVQPSAKALREASLIASFFEGVPHAVGQARYEKFLQRKAEKELGL